MSTVVNSNIINLAVGYASLELGSKSSVSVLEAGGGERSWEVSAAWQVPMSGTELCLDPSSVMITTSGTELSLEVSLIEASLEASGVGEAGVSL